MANGRVASVPKTGRGAGNRGRFAASALLSVLFVFVAPGPNAFAVGPDSSWTSFINNDFPASSLNPDCQPAGGGPGCMAWSNANGYSWPRVQYVFDQTAIFQSEATSSVNNFVNPVAPGGVGSSNSPVLVTSGTVSGTLTINRSQINPAWCGYTFDHSPGGAPSNYATAHGVKEQLRLDWATLSLSTSKSYNNYGQFSPTTCEVRNIYNHEFGHSLGLGHTNDANQTMYPQNEAVYTAQSGDQLGIACMYNAGCGPWFDWETLNSPGVGLLSGSHPSVFASSSNHLDVWMTGGDSRVWHRTWDGTAWQPWENGADKPPPGATLSPAAVTGNPGTLDVFVRGGDSALWQRTWINGVWYAWHSLGGILTSEPTVASWAPGRLDVFARGTDNGMWHNWWDGAWHGFEALGGTLTSAPAAVARTPGALETFARSSDNAMWHDYWTGTSWSGWSSLGGQFTSGPGASSMSAGRMDLFARGTDNNDMWHLWWNGTVWSVWEADGGTLSSDPCAASWGSGRIDIFSQSNYQSGMWHKWYQL